MGRVKAFLQVCGKKIAKNGTYKAIKWRKMIFLQFSIFKFGMRVGGLHKPCSLGISCNEFGKGKGSYMKKKGTWIAVVALGCALLVGVVGIALFSLGTGEGETRVVSAGVQYLADGAHVAASAPMGESVTFSPEWFDNALQGGRVSAITVTRLPDVTAGELMLGYGEVSVGQTIRRENLSYLRFAPMEGASAAAFCFVPQTVEGAAGYEVSCALSLTDGVNCCPESKGARVAVSTHAGLSHGGVLEAEDPEGDALFFEVVRYPENGTLSLDGATGAFVYLPNEGFDGADSFVWRVQDVHGAYGEDATVDVTVHPLVTGYFFADMADNGAHSAALSVTEAGLLSGQTMGGKHYFHPERTLTRAAFVAILLKAAEVEFPEAESTGYTDDADIPKGMKGAIKYAREQGWLGEDTVFRPHDAITRAEAATIATRVLGLDAPGYSEAVRDHDMIPVTVVDALYAALEGGYLQTMTDGTLSHTKALTRAEAAVFFAEVME